MDFPSDQLFDGRKIRALSIIDNFTRVSPALDVRTSYRGSDVVETLDLIAAVHGRPKRIRLDKGPEFISKDLDLWDYQHDVVLDFSRPGKPTDNAFAEAFNGWVRAECLNAYWFLSLGDAGGHPQSHRADRAGADERRAAGGDDRRPGSDADDQPGGRTQKHPGSGCYRGATSQDGCGDRI